MAPPAPQGRSSYHLHGLIKVAIFTVVFIFFLSMLPSKSDFGRMRSKYPTINYQYISSRYIDCNHHGRSLIGSKPPACLNKCKNCRPCEATLVVPNHQKRKGFKVSSRGDDNDTYYLLSWKCRCGNKLFQP